MNEIQKRRNKCNRKRGGRFEKVGADFLDMDVVPYSGSNDRFGWGDVRDSKWLGEFKNITPKDGRCKILAEWFEDNTRKADGYGLMPFLAWMPAGKPDKYIILDCDTFIKLGMDHDITVEIPKKSVVAVNMFIDINDNWVKLVRTRSNVAQLKFGTSIYYMMDMSLFRDIINTRGLKGVRQNYGGQRQV